MAGSFPLTSTTAIRPSPRSVHRSKMLRVFRSSVPDTFQARLHLHFTTVSSQWDFFPWKIQVAFPGECVHRLKINNRCVCMWLHTGEFGHCERVCTESLKVDSGRKIPCHTGELNCVSGMLVWCSTNWATSSPSRHEIAVAKKSPPPPPVLFGIYQNSRLQYAQDSRLISFHPWRDIGDSKQLHKPMHNYMNQWTGISMVKSTRFAERQTKLFASKYCENWQISEKKNFMPRQKSMGARNILYRQLSNPVTGPTILARKTAFWSRQTPY